MALNREQKRQLRKQGELGEDGEPIRKAQPPQSRQARAQQERTSAPDFAREVRSELKKVAWPNRSEVINYSIVVFITVVLLTTLIAGFDWLFAESVLQLFDT